MPATMIDYAEVLAQGKKDYISERYGNKERRDRFNVEETEVLERHFQEGMNWTREKVTLLSNQLNRSR